MKPKGRNARRSRSGLAVAFSASTLLVSSLLAYPSPALAATPIVLLGSAGSYSVLAGTGVASTGSTSLSGDLGVSPSNSIGGFPPGIVEGATHAGDPQAAQAQTDMMAAYTDAAARTPTTNFAGDQNGQTFSSGVHHTAAAFALTGTMTLDGQNNPNAVFIFQVDAALNTAAASHITLINGAKASHVFWQVVGAAGTGASSTFTGTIMAQGAVTIGALAGLDGRAMSRGTITLAGNTLTTPGSGVLSINVPADAGNLGTTANTVSGGSISGLLGQVEVDDGRDAAAGSGWNASVVSTDFSASNGQLIAASSVDYTAGTLTGVGTVTLTADDPDSLTAAASAVTATEIAGNNSATWNPSIHVLIAGSTVAGIYSAVITHSVL